MNEQDASGGIILKLESEHTLEIERKPKTPKAYCYDHLRHVIVDSENRTIECKLCGNIVDPFAYIEKWAIEGERRMAGLDGIKARIRIANAEFKRLEQRVDNMRAQLKRAGNPQPEVERREYRNALLNARP